MPTPILYDETPCQVAGLLGPCHVFRGCKTPDGYGLKWHTGRKLQYTHRIAWEAIHGPIPDRLLIDHLCRNRACCNPDHLRLVTPKQNSTENIIGGTAQKGRAMTHCKRGHEFTKENTYRPKRRTGNERQCRTCRRLAVEKWLAAKEAFYGEKL
jgi:hypothetical protein